MHRHRPAPPRMTFAPPPPHGCRRVDPDRHSADPDRRPHTDLVYRPRMTSEPPLLHDRGRRRRPVAPARPPPPHDRRPRSNGLPQSTLLSSAAPARPPARTRRRRHRRPPQRESVLLWLVRPSPGTWWGSIRRPRAEGERGTERPVDVRRG
jgi:hypothetical protein